MNNYLFPLHYLRLEGPSKNLLVRRDFVPTILVTILLSLPFILVSNSNYVHEGGFLDRVGSFCAVLSGFYFAGLIAVASLNSNFADLDEEITVGEVRAPSQGEERGDLLTRREYVCYMFSYMAFLSLIFSFFSITMVIIVDSLDFKKIDIQYFSVDREYIRLALIVGVSAPLASLILTTLRGLYYLAGRLYYEAPKIDNSKSPED